MIPRSTRRKLPRTTRRRRWHAVFGYAVSGLRPTCSGANPSRLLHHDRVLKRRRGKPDPWAPWQDEGGRRVRTLPRSPTPLDVGRSVMPRWGAAPRPPWAALSRTWRSAWVTPSWPRTPPPSTWLRQTTWPCCWPTLSARYASTTEHCCSNRCRRCARRAEPPTTPPGRSWATQAASRRGSRSSSGGGL
jgi:hypothetical protein